MRTSIPPGRLRSRSPVSCRSRLPNGSGSGAGSKVLPGVGLLHWLGKVKSRQCHTGVENANKGWIRRKVHLGAASVENLGHQENVRDGRDLPMPERPRL